MEDIDSLIISRLGEHQRKVDFINNNFNRRSDAGSVFKKIGYTVISVAACLAIVIAVSPVFFRGNNMSDSLTPPSFAEFRGSSFNNIESLIIAGRYDDALLLVDSELSDIDSESELISSTDMNDDERLYLTSLYRAEKEELIWCRIYLSVMLDKKDEIGPACLIYLNNSDFTKHKSEVENILKKNQ